MRSEQLKQLGIKTKRPRTCLFVWSDLLVRRALRYEAMSCCRAVAKQARAYLAYVLTLKNALH
jgi:hypothetical protein